MTFDSLNHIKELPLSIQQMVGRFSLKLLENLGDNVTTILIYGSAVSGNFKPGISNVNMALIVKRLDVSVLKQVSLLFKGLHKKRVDSPLLLTQEYILNSLDVFPIEFMEIKQCHKVIFGEDFFSSLEIPRKDLRLLCEQQIKGKLLHLRQAFLNLGSNAAVLRKFVVHVFYDLIPVFRCLIDLKGKAPCSGKEDMLRQLATIFSLDENVLLGVYKERHKKFFITKSSIEIHFQNLLNVLEILARHMDSL